MKIFLLNLCFILLLISCESDKSEQAKKEILEVERKFDSITQIKGVKEAFILFADDSSVFNRGEKLVKGKNAILEFYSNPKYQKVNLSWKPDYVFASKSGDLGYTYGSYKYTSQDSIGNKIEHNGIFHTVWKKNLNGEWKIAWD